MLQTKFLIVVTLLFALCANAQSSNQVLPAKAFGQLPDITSVRLSPNGESIVWKVRYETPEHQGVAIQAINLKTDTKKILTLTDNSKFVVGWMDWANDEEVLLGVYYPSRYYQTPVTRTQLLKINATTAESSNPISKNQYKRFGIIPVQQDNIVDFLPNNPDEFLLSLRTENNVATQVLKINHKTKRSKTVHRLRADTLDWITDRQNRIRIAYRFDDTSVQYDYRKPDEKKWRELFEYEVFSKHAAVPLGFDEDPNILYYTALHEGRDAIFKTDLSKAEENQELVFSSEQFDVSGSLVYSHKSKKVVGIRHDVEDGYYFWDEEFKIINRTIDHTLSKTKNSIIGFSRDERRFLILATSDDDPGTYYLWDRDAKSMEILAYRYDALLPENLVKKQSIKYEARDGLSIHAYLTQPEQNIGKAAATIIFPHGGPISYSGSGFDYWTQFFANQGYNVLQMNFRGSSGYGHDFMTSGLQDWGGKMQTDVEDGTRWLIEEGIADPKKICVVGASYGGYAALMEAANDNQLYQCAVSFAGVTDLNHLVADSRKYINHKVVKEMIGSKSRELKQKSPVNLADEVNIPILLAHGTKDLSVPIKQGRKMHSRLKSNDKDVTYLEFDEGSHYLDNEVHRVELFEAMARFLKKHLQ